MPKFSRTDGSLNYQILSSGPATAALPIFVIPGISLSGRFYQEFSEALTSYSKVILPDHRRTGRSTARLPWTYKIADIAKDLIEIADHEGIKDFHVVGESYGGMVAMSLAIDYPQRVKSLCLINSSFGGSRHPRLKTMAFISTLTSMSNPFKWYRGLEHRIFSPRTHRESPEVIKKWFETAMTEGMPIITTQKQLMAALKFFPKKQLQKLNLPTLVVYGSEDRLVPYRNSIIISQTISHAKLHKVVEGGHHLCGEQPKVIAPLIIAFVKSVKIS